MSILLSLCEKGKISTISLAFFFAFHSYVIFVGLHFKKLFSFWLFFLLSISYILIFLHDFYSCKLLGRCVQKSYASIKKHLDQFVCFASTGFKWARYINPPSFLFLWIKVALSQLKTMFTVFPIQNIWSYWCVGKLQLPMM